jgi:hypothetical protein
VLKKAISYPANTVTVTDYGPADATSVMMRDSLPPLVLLIGWNGICSFAEPSTAAVRDCAAFGP